MKKKKNEYMLKYFVINGLTLEAYRRTVTPGIQPIFTGRTVQSIKVVVISRLTIVSREAKKKQHACASSGPRDHYSELFTRMAALKL